MESYVLQVSICRFYFFYSFNPRGKLTGDNSMKTSLMQFGQQSSAHWPLKKDALFHHHPLTLFLKENFVAF